MIISLPFLPRRLVRTASLLVGIALLVSACSTPEPGTLGANAAYDPYEAQNRSTHEFNKSLDRHILRPAGREYQAVPLPIQNAISNFSTNLSMPGVAVNSLLQGDLGGVGLALASFVMNTTIGLGGLLDASGEFGIPVHDTDFGETLHVWGAPEGAFIELPILGPSTERDAVGRFVDLFTNPLVYGLDGVDLLYGYTASVLTSVGDRGRFSDTIDFILYQSADSYAQSRLIFIQNRRFDLGVDVRDDEDDETDPYDDFFTDPYEDPYAE